MEDSGNQILSIDLLSPFLIDVISRCRKEEKNPFSIHLEKNKKGHIGAILAQIVGIESPNLPTNLTDILINLDFLKQEVEKPDSGFVIALTPEEIIKANVNNKIALLLALKGEPP